MYKSYKEKLTTKKKYTKNLLDRSYFSYWVINFTDLVWSTTNHIAWTESKPKGVWCDLCNSGQKISNESAIGFALVLTFKTLVDTEQT